MTPLRSPPSSSSNPLRPRLARALRELAREPFLPPDFCRTSLLFSSLVAAELIIVVISLAEIDGGRWTFERFLAASVMSLWMALAAAVVLCKARPWLLRLPLAGGAVLCWLLPVSTVWLASIALMLADVALPFGLELSGGSGRSFATRNALIAAVVYAALLRYFYVQEQWLRNERAQARAAVDALQARIRPHFLFNSMNSIASLVRRDPLTAERAIEDLADLFRAALGASEGMSTLGEELSLCQRYLDIEKLRLAERLQVKLDVEDAALLQVAAPRLSLQPLVENAIHHGVARLAAGGEIGIRIWGEPGSVAVSIVNPVPATPAAVDAGNRHALSNIEQRLAYHFGDRARLSRGREGGDYRVTLRLPRSAAPAASR